jgi:hypothetical protein
MRKLIVIELTLIFILLQSFFAFSQGTFKELSFDFPNDTSINKVVWNGENFFLVGESNTKSAILGKYDLSSNQFKSLSNLLPTNYLSLNGCVWAKNAIFVVGNGKKKAVMGEYIPSTGYFKDLTNKIPYYWKYNLSIAYNGKLLAIVGESADGMTTMGTYDPSKGKFLDLSNEINKNGFLESVASNGKSFFAVGWKTTMPQSAIAISYNPLLEKLTDVSTTSKLKRYDTGINEVVWDGSEYLFVSNYAFGKYKDNSFEDLSDKLNAIHLNPPSSNSSDSYMYARLNGLACENGNCILFGNGILATYNLKKGKMTENVIFNYPYISLQNATWDGKEFLMVGKEKGKTRLFTFKP